MGEIKKIVTELIGGTPLLQADRFAAAAGAKGVTILTKLEYLELFSCNLVDISWMENLTHLIDLNFAQNNVLDCSVLVNLKQLKRLYLWQRNWAYRQLDLPSKLPHTFIMNNKKLCGYIPH